MQASVAVVLLLCIGIVYCAPFPPQNLYPIYADGFETVILNDMSFANELSFQTWSPTNFTMYVYGQSAIRTVYPGDPSFHVGVTPNEFWHVPFIDFHTFQNGTDVWGIGPVNALYARNRTDQNLFGGFQLEIAVVTTRQFPGNNNNGRFFLTQPLGFEGTYFSTRVVGFEPDNVIAYFAGFFANYTNPAQLHFGIRRAHFNVSQFANGNVDPSQVAWYSNHSIDEAVIYPFAQFVAYNADFKPMLFHARNLSATAPPNTTWLAVVDPYLNTINLIMGNYNPTVPLTVSSFSWIPTGFGGASIASAAVSGEILLVGVSVAGTGTGWIEVLHLANLTQRNPAIHLPTNYSDPRALVVDYFNPVPTLYVGMNGGAAILRIDILSGKITGYQALPFYLHRTWRGQATHEHVYFITNEQHSKVYRLAKDDFCPTECMTFGYCHKGKCVCSPHLDLQNGQCVWHQLVVEKKIAKTEKGGEIALGIFFALATVAAAAGWYFVWKNKRGAYQAV